MGRAAGRAAPARSATPPRVVNSGYSPSHEVFVTCLEAPKGRVAALFAAAVAAVSLGMAAVYAAAAAAAAAPAAAAPPLVSLLVHSFSVTVGGPALLPAGRPAEVAAGALHSLLSQLLFLFFTGVAFARFSRPAQSLLAARVALVTRYQGERCFLCRVAVARTPPELVDVRFHLTFKHTRANGFTRLEELALVKAHMPLLRGGLYVRHPIDGDSPLAGFTAGRMAEEAASVRLTVIGLDPVSLQTIVTSIDYAVRGGGDGPRIVYGGAYRDLLYTDACGTRVMDLARLHDVVEGGGGGGDSDDDGDGDGQDGDGDGPGRVDRDAESTCSGMSASHEGPWRRRGGGAAAPRH